MAITPAPGWMVNPSNPNSVIPATSSPSGGTPLPKPPAAFTQGQAASAPPNAVPAPGGGWMTAPQSAPQPTPSPSARTTVANGPSAGYSVDSAGNVYDKGGGLVTPNSPAYNDAVKYASAPSPTGANPTAIGGPDSTFSAAQAAIAPSAKTPTIEDFYSEIQGQLQPVIDAINQAEIAAETAANVDATQQTSGQNFAMNAQGLAGSSEASAMAKQIDQSKAAAIAQAKQAKATALENVANLALPEAFSAYQAALTRNDTNAQAYITQQQTVLKNALGGLAASGETLNDLAQTNPIEYQQLLQYAGGDPNALNLLFLQASQASLLNNGQPVATTGNTLVYGIQTRDANGNPSLKTIAVPLPPGVPQGYKMTTNATTALGGIYTQYAPVGADGTTITDPTQVVSYLNGQQIGGPGTPPGNTISSVTGSDQAVSAYVSGIQNGTITSIAQVPAQYKSQVAEAMAQQGVSSPLADSRFTMAVNRIVANYINLPGYQLTANGLPYLQRIQAAERTPGSVSDQDLLDSMTKLNTSGNALSDAQVKVITDGQTYADWASVIKQKLTTGGVLSQSQRDQIAKIASSIYKNYQQGYQPIYDQVTKQLTEAGIPQDFWTIPDLNTLYAGQTGTTADASPNTASTTSVDVNNYSW